MSTAGHLNPSFGSPNGLQSKLDFSGCGCRAINHTYAGNQRSGLIKNRTICDGGSKVGMIEHIEKLRTKLKVKGFGDSRDTIILEQRKI